MNLFQKIFGTIPKVLPCKLCSGMPHIASWNDGLDGKEYKDREDIIVIHCLGRNCENSKGGPFLKRKLSIDRWNKLQTR